MKVMKKAIATGLAFTLAAQERWLAAEAETAQQTQNMS